MIIPGILENTFEDTKKRIEEVDNITPIIQIDICDGLFVSTKNSFEIKKLEEIDMKSDLQIHLMTKRIDGWINKKIKNIKSVCIHFESEDFSESITKKIKDLGYEVGLSINPNTSFAEIEGILNNFDFVQLMTVYPGKQGQKFLTQVLDGFKKLKENHPTLKFQMDGGINEENIRKLVEIGIDNFVIGSAIFKSYNPRQKLIEFIQTAYGNSNI